MRPLHPCLIWMDRRANAEVDWVRATLDMERLADITGNGVDSYYGYTKMLWLRNNRPDVFRRTRYFLPPNAFVIHALTGELAVDRSSAGNIGGVYDIGRGDVVRPRCSRARNPCGNDAGAARRIERHRRRLDARCGANDLGLPPGTPVDRRAASMPPSRRSPPA